MGVSHEQRCRKYKEQIQNLKITLVETQEELEEIKLQASKRIRLSNKERIIVSSALEALETSKEIQSLLKRLK
jgi:hypothetical protein